MAIQFPPYAIETILTEKDAQPLDYLQRDICEYFEELNDQCEVDNRFNPIERRKVKKIVK